MFEDSRGGLWPPLSVESQWGGGGVGRKPLKRKKGLGEIISEEQSFWEKNSQKGKKQGAYPKNKKKKSIEKKTLRINSKGKEVKTPGRDSGNLRRRPVEEW